MSHPRLGFVPLPALPVLPVLAVLTALLIVATACSSAETGASFCESLVGDEVGALLGDTELEPFSVEPLQECVWTSTASPEQSITVRVEDVPDGPLFVEHAIEATAVDRVRPLEIGEDSVLFVDEAVLGRSGDRIALITATLDTELLVPVLEQALDQLS